VKPPVATAMVFAPMALPQAMSKGVSPMIKTRSGGKSIPSFSLARASANGPSSLRMWLSSA